MKSTLIIITALLLAPLTALHAADAPSKKPNILIILADDLGYGDAGCYGGEMVPTPNIDRLAAGGVRCTDGYVAAPVCAPSRVGLLSGAYPQRLGVHWNEDVWDNAIPGLRLPDSHLTLPETLRAAGYATGHLGKWNFPRDARKACDEVDDLMNFGGDYFPDTEGNYQEVNGAPFRKAKGGGKDYDQGIWGPAKPSDEYLTDRIGRHAVEFIERHRGQEKPFFLYLAFNAPHSPYQAKQVLRERFGKIEPEPMNFYAAMIASMDENIGRVIDKLRADGLLDNTLIVFTSDNGPAPPLHDGWKPEWPKDLTMGSAGPLSGRKAQFLEGGIREPFIIHWPARLKPGEYHRPVSTLDLYPTLCAAAGAAIPAETKLDGVNVLPHLLGENQADPHTMLFWGKHDDKGEMGAVREGDWKLVLQHWKPKLQLYNLATDLSEKHDLAAEQPERVAKMHTAWIEWNAQLAPPASVTAKKAKAAKASPATSTKTSAKATSSASPFTGDKMIVSEDFSQPDAIAKWRWGAGKWTVADGVLNGTETAERKHPAGIACQRTYHDAEIHFRFQFVGGSTAMLLLRNKFGNLCRVTITRTSMTLTKDKPNSPASTRERTVVLDKATLKLQPNAWYAVTATVQGEDFTATLQDQATLKGHHPAINVDKTEIEFLAGGDSILFDDLRASIPEPK